MQRFFASFLDKSLTRTVEFLHDQSLFAGRTKGYTSTRQGKIMSDKHTQVTESHTANFANMVDTNTGKIVEGQAEHILPR
jgi:hypothetical protein